MKKILTLAVASLLLISTFTRFTLQVEAEIVDQYFVYSKFDPPGIGDVVAVGGYIEYYGVPEWGDEIQYVYFLSGTTGYKVRVWVTDGDGDGKIEPRQHPNHYLEAFRGPIEPRHFQIVSSKDLTGYTGGSSWHTEEFYIDSSGVYLGAYPYGINKWDHNWNYIGKIANPPPTRTESLAYNPAENVWYAGGRNRTIYELRDTDNDGSFLDESWKAIFTYPDYGGDHHDGLEYVAGYLWISDMTSDVIGKWWYNPTTQKWEELKRFTYTEVGYVEGMGFGPNDHFWIGSGWGSNEYIYELGNEITLGYPIADAGPDVPNHPPIIPVKFDASGSRHTDPTKQIVLYEWDFESDGVWDYSGTDLIVEHAYPAYYNPDGSIDWSKTAKDYIATLRVTDNSSPPLHDTDTCIVHITAPPWKPVADPNGPYEGTVGAPIQLDGSKSYDPESKMFPPGHPWYETIAKYEWDLDYDGIPEHFNVDATGIKLSWTWNTEGKYIIGLRVTDSQPSGPAGTIGPLDVDIKYTTVVIKKGRIINVAVILAKPLDMEPEHTEPSYYRNIAENLVNYYDEVSYGVLHIGTVDIYDNSGNWYRLDGKIWEVIPFIPDDYGSNIFYGKDRKLVNWTIPIVNIKLEWVRDFTILFAIEAVMAADKDLNFNNYDAVIVIHPGSSSQSGRNDDLMLTAYYDITFPVITPDDLYPDVARRLIVIAEDEGVGVWAHEIGHALGDIIVGKTLPDRYENGWVGRWCLMCYGCYAAPPTHLCSYSKEFLKWLRYKEVSYGTYWVNSLETMKFNDEVLIFKYKKVWYEIPNYYIIEARTNLYGDYSKAIPYNYALLLYNVDVRLGRPDTVNLLPPNVSWRGSQVITIEGGEYSDLDAQVRFKLVETKTETNKLEIKVLVDKCSCKKLKGASLVPAANILNALQPFLSTPPVTPMPLPDIDLHAYSQDGRHIGINYETGEYEIQIPGAYASGDLLNGREWIFVPEDVNVYFIVNAKDNDEFFDAFPEAWKFSDGIETFDLSLIYYDSNGNRWESTPITEQINPGETIWHIPDIIENPDGTYTTGLTPITWECIFEDPVRHTTLKISTNDKHFQFITPDKEFLVKHDPNMKITNRAIVIIYKDWEIKIATVAVDTKLDFCIAIAWDQQTRKQYILIDKVGKNKTNPLIPPFSMHTCSSL